MRTMQIFVNIYLHLCCPMTFNVVDFALIKNKNKTLFSTVQYLNGYRNYFAYDYFSIIIIVPPRRSSA